MMAPRTSRLRVASRLLVLLVVVYGFCWISGFPRQYDDDELPPEAQRAKAGTSPAPHHVELNQLVVSVRTTAADVHTKLPPLLFLTNQKYHDTLLLMSDLQMDIGAFHVHDVLDRLDVNLVATNPELTRYRQQLDLARTSIDVGAARAQTAQEEKETMAKLDKYKVMRMLERAWELKPDKNWYVFVDTETYLVRSNLMSWLGQFDPSTSIFFANPPDADSTEPFAITGNTFILSGEAMHSLFVDRVSSIALWDTRAIDFMSSFDVLYSALSAELSLTVNRTWPAISGFHPSTAPYGPGLWCEHVMAMHDVPTDVASDLWRFERDREEYQHVRDPLLFADLWIRFLQPEELGNPRSDWDNLSSGLENARWNILFEGVEPDVHRHHHRDEEGRAADGEESWEACRESCDKNERCVQWSYSKIASPNYNENGATKCHVSRSMRYGGHVQPVVMLEEGGKVQQTWQSGWRKDNFEKWARQQRCKGQQN
ncbi:glycosyltransferase family 31 protein [Melanomma pulvis-pyrius CBS 109.77]|uniref:Glycosyltransferase family 31 protein n=1 Tax=Melanomma pulvis-pyrius CBS 109.77 TaxID=1314802 RepID=A0A6A6WXB1_9PLEO|nr:glycosyltransferase family 31 protein [Melanomma pulvis-pyrius CBS 109.77]